MEDNNTNIPAAWTRTDSSAMAMISLLLVFSNTITTQEGPQEDESQDTLPLYPGALSDCHEGILILPVFALYRSQSFARCLLMGPIWNEGERKDFL